MMQPGADIVPSSFRDPGGFLFFDGSGRLCRQINLVERDNYEQLIGSGLYERLVSEGLLIRHVEDTTVEPPRADSYKIIRPEPVAFVSYPFEWCFGQLRDAALLTLQIQKLALAHGMSLKDASAYNVQ
jgi:hypothetical protein